jgi:hypothetical protein
VYVYIRSGVDRALKRKVLAPAEDETPESESELLYDWQFTAKQFVFAPSPLRDHDHRGSF